MKSSLARRSLASWLLLTVAAATIAVATACGESDGSVTISATSTPSPDLRSPAGDSTVTVTPPPPPSEYRLVYSEFGNEADTIWLVNPADPAEREKIVTIPHRATFGINPSLSPDGRLLAYLSQPETAPSDPFLSRADLMVLDLTSGHTERMLENVDIAITPLWAPDGRLLYVRQKAGPNPFSADIVITQITIAEPPPPGETVTPSPTPSPTPTGSPGPVATPFNPVKEIIRQSVSQVLSFVPVGFAADDESLYFVQIAGGTGGQTLLGAYAPATTESIATVTAIFEATATAVSEQSPTPSPDPSGPPTPPTPSPTPGARLVLPLIDQLISAPELSPDRTQLSFLAPALVDGDVLERVLIADVVNRAVAPLPAEGLPSGSQVGPVWHPDGERLAIGFERSSGTAGAVALVPVTGGSLTFLPAPTAGFDEPLSWSPDGGSLAVLHHAESGQGRLELVAPTGQRGTVQDGPDFRILGWFKAGEVAIPPSTDG